MILRLSFKFVFIVLLGRPLYKFKKCNGPIGDPCRTPYLTIPQLEQVLFKNLSIKSHSALYLQGKI
jgi:hypothetical protein